VATLLQEQFEVVVVGRGEVDELDWTSELTVEAGGHHWTQVLVMKTNHHAAVPHQLAQVFLGRTSVL